MSGPNSDYDPVEVTPLKAEEVEAMRTAALAAIEAAADLDELKRVRVEHAGDRSPLALANREIGALPPQARKEAGMRVGQARGAVNQALAARQEVLEAEHEERMLVEETVDVTLPWDRTPVGARHPLTTLAAGGCVYWTTLPRTCSIGDGPTCREMVIARASETGNERVTPRLADGTYVSVSALAWNGDDLYAANARGIYKVARGELQNPLEPVCSIPSSFPVKLSSATILAGPTSAGFAVSSNGFVLPLRTSDSTKSETI